MIIEVQFRGLARLDRAINNYKDNLNSLYRHPDMTLTQDWALRNVIMSAYSHYIDTWPMNGACVGHRAVLMRSMLRFAMHFGCYRHRQCHNAKDHRRKGTPATTPSPAIDLDALLTDEEENLKLEQINPTHPGILDLLGDLGNLLYAKPHSMAKHFDAMMVGARLVGELPSRECCRDSEVLACVYEDEAQQCCQKILWCLDIRVLDGDLVVPTCLRMPTLILPTGRFMQLYYNPDTQGRYASQFPSDSRGFLQPRGDIRESIVPRAFRTLPMDIREVVDAYFHRKELEDRASKDAEDDQEMSTDTKATLMVRRLKVNDPMATASLQGAVHDTLAPATAPRLQESDENYYDSDDSVLDLDEEYPGLGECIIEWQATRQGTASLPPWHPPNFGQLEQSCYSKEPDLREILNQVCQARTMGSVPVQPVAPMPLPFTSVRDLDRQRQQHFKKWQSSPLDGEQCKWARTPPQPDPEGAPVREHARNAGHEDREWGCSRIRHDVDRQQELDKARSKSRAHSKSCRRSKSHKCSKSKRHSKSHRCSRSRPRTSHEARKPGIWPRDRSPSKGCPVEDRPHQQQSTTSHSHEQAKNTG